MIESLTGRPPEAWMLTVKPEHNRRSVQQRTAERTTSRIGRAVQRTALGTPSRKNEDRNASITADHHDTNGEA